MNNSFLKRSAAVFFAAVLAAGAVSCSKASNESASSNTNLVGEGPQGDVAEEELPYGATITQLKHEYDENALITIEFDHRFFKAEDGSLPEIYRITEYFEAINNSDADLMEKAYYPGLYESICGTSGKLQYIQDYHDKIAYLIAEYQLDNKSTNTDGSFRINYLMVDAIDDETTDPDSFTAMDNTLAACDSSALAKVTRRRRVALTGMYTLTKEGGSFDLNSAVQQNAIYLYIYDIDGASYII